MNQKVTTYIENTEEKNKAILQKIRELIMNITTHVDELFKWGRPVYRTDKDFCYLQSTKKAVTVGFFEFDKIETNSHLIEGTGKSMRHIKIKSLEDIGKFEIEKMILEALK